MKIDEKLHWLKVKLIFFWRKRRHIVRLSFENGIPKLHIHEKYKVYIKWTLRILILIGIASSVIVFPQWYFNLCVAIVLFLVGQFFEKSIFVFTTLFVQPIPDSYKPEEWMGMLWGWGPATASIIKGKDVHYVIGPFFNNLQSAKKIFSCLTSWNYNEIEDINNNIQLSVIIEPNGHYHMYMYPGFERPSMAKWFKEMENEHPNEEHLPTIVQIIFCKEFDFDNSNLKEFLKRYKQGDRFIFQAYIFDGRQPQRYENGGLVLKNQLKIKRREELTKGDIEYEHGKFIMGI